MNTDQLLSLTAGEKRIRLLDTVGSPGGLLVAGGKNLTVRVQAPCAGYPLRLSRYGIRYVFEERPILVAFIAIHEIAHFLIPGCDEAAADALAAALLRDLAAVQVRESAGYTGT